MVNYFVGPSTVNPYLVQWVQSGFGRDGNVERKCTDEGRRTPTGNNSSHNLQSN